MLNHNLIKISVVIAVSASLFYNPAFALTESVDLFGEINSVDLILNDIWIEPENPKEGDAVSIHGSVYNAGVIRTEDVSDAVTMAFIVNGEIAEITLLQDILPGIENGIQVSSGPVLDSSSGEYIITGILNYHDTLSHLRDNPANNIVQKKIRIGDSQPSIITSEIYQMYDKKNNSQLITINGQLNNFFQERLGNQEVTIKIGEVASEKITTSEEGRFSMNTDIPFVNEIIKVSMNVDNNSVIGSPSQVIYPVKLNQGESIMTFEIFSDSQEYDFKNSEFTIVIFQDNYEKMLDKIDTNQFDKQDAISDDIFSVMVPSNHEYIVEIYYEGRFLDAFQSFFEENSVAKKDIFIPENGQVKFIVLDENNKPQANVRIENWIYSSITNQDGTTEWIEILPTIIPNEPYVAKAIFSDGSVTWSEPFLLESNEEKTISIVKESFEP